MRIKGYRAGRIPNNTFSLEKKRKLSLYRLARSWAEPHSAKRNRF